MDMLWKIALRNVLRHRRRTVITAIVMMVGIGLYIAYDSVLAGMDRITIDTMVQYSSSYLKLRTPEYASDALGMPLEHGIPDSAGAMAALLKAAPGLSAVAPRTLFLAQASNYRDTEPQVVAAVDPSLDAKVFDVAAAVTKGSWLSTPLPGAVATAGPVAGNGSGATREVVVSQTVASDLGLGLGDNILLSARTIYDNWNADEYRIVGLLGGGVSLGGTGTIYMSYADARAFLGDGLPVTELDAAAPRATTLDAELAGSAKAASLANTALPALTADPVGEFAKDYLAMRDSKSKGSTMLIVMILFIAAVGIVNTILMSVYSRVREIGVLRAYGMTPKDVKRLFVREGIMIGVVGSLAGLVLGGAIVWYFAAVGLSMGDLFKGIDLGAIPTNAVLHGEVRPQAFAFGFAFGVFVSWIAARIPAKRAGRLEPTDALRFV